MPARLVTIAPSHYCEKARWALDRAGWRYTEDRHIPMLHYLVSFPTARQRTVPILVTPHGKIGDSTAILQFIDRSLPEEVRLFPEEGRALRAQVEELEAEFDRRLGPATRRLAYFRMLPHEQLFVDTITAGMGPFPRAAAKGLAPVLRVGLRRGLNLTEDGAARSLKRVEEIFDTVDKLLADGRAFLAGPRFTAADLTFASLAAPVLLPPGYGSWLPAFEDLPSDIASDLAPFRKRPAGEFALRLYLKERHRVVGTPS
jgi:glutathione S-transferase